MTENTKDGDRFVADYLSLLPMKLDKIQVRAVVLWLLQFLCDRGDFQRARGFGEKFKFLFGCHDTVIT